MKIKKAIKTIVIIAIILVVGTLVAYFVIGRKPKVEYSTSPVVRGNIIQTVSETGTVKAVNEINLSFLNAGKIKNIYCQVGDKVIKDQLLAELDYSSLDLKKREGEANLEVAKQNLAKLLAGAAAEEIRVAQASVKQAEAAYESAKLQLAAIKDSTDNTVAQAEKTLADLQSLDPAIVSSKRTYVLNSIQSGINSMNTSLDSQNKIITDQDKKYYLGVSNPTQLANAQVAYNNALPLVNVANSSFAIATQNRNDSNISQAVKDALSALNMTLSSLNYFYSALQGTVTNSLYTQTELDTDKTTISTAITTVNTAITTIQSAHQTLVDAIITAQNSLSSAKLSASQQQTAYQTTVDSTYNAWQVAIAQLNKITAAPNQYDVSLLFAQIQQVQAALDSVNKSIEDSKIKAQINGTITIVNNEAGEQATPGKTVISILGDSNFEIEALIPESDIQKVVVDDKVETTFDAFGEDEKFYGKIYFIEPAETTVQDVIYYRVKINFDQRGKEVKSGMTANVIITTAEKSNVLTIPTRAIVDKNGGGKFVKILVNNQEVEKKVEIGLAGDEGVSEVLAGLNEGEKVITYTSTSN
ncbi:MAG: efflux RND transporter periplasmic adaptor subunit [Candidatus Falkowbacteria bacterium]|nr:efflux RND transporter periplasmic adaptor subunit [Candidatus Falkowbacteria bacterium]